MYTLELEQHNRTFESQKYYNVLFVSFKTQRDFLMEAIEQREELLTFFDGLRHDIKVVIFSSPPKQLDRDNFFEVFRSWTEVRRQYKTIFKICETLDKYILKLVNTDKIFISALTGNMDFGFFSFSLACDYRIVTSDFTVQQPETKLGMLLRDSGEFFLSRIMGALKTIEIMASDRDITANELFALGLVDEVVSCRQHGLLQRCFNMATNLAGSSFSELKHLKKYPLKNLEEYLEFKNRRFLEFITGRTGKHEVSRQFCH